MNFASIIRILATLSLTIAALMILPLGIALGRGENAQAISFGITLVLIALLAGSVLSLTPRPKRRANSSDALAAAIFCWLLSGILGAAPFVIGVANQSILAALHESVSCLTTTGHSVIEIGDGGWPISLIVWRGILHILGAIMTLTIAASVFAAINLGGPGIHRTELFTLPSGSFFSAVPRVLSAASVFVMVLVSVFTILLVFAGAPGGNALATSVSAITTGLVDPEGAAVVNNPAQRLVVTTALILGTLGLYFALSLRRMNFMQSFYDPEVFAFLLVITGLTMLAMVAGLGPWEGSSWSLSALSTSGIQTTSDNVALLLPIPLIVLPALIGGSALSAAGGIKLGRLVILVRRTMQEFGSLGFRGSIVKFVYRGRSLEESSVVGVWVYLIGYIGAIVLLIGVLSFAGSNFESAVPTAIGAISNSGSLIDTDISTGNLHLALIFAMLLGRWEILALLPLFVPAFWQK